MSARIIFKFLTQKKKLIFLVIIVISFSLVLSFVEIGSKTKSINPVTQALIDENVLNILKEAEREISSSQTTVGHFTVDINKSLDQEDPKKRLRDAMNKKAWLLFDSL